jgi:hypothetical protein
MKVGRPSKYDPKYIEEVDRYLAETGGSNMHLPKVESFAIRVGASKKALYAWAKKHPRFRNALMKIKLYQAQQLIDDGIYGGKEVNSTIVKLLLMNNHGMMERRDTTTKGKKLPSPIYDGKSEV